MECFGEFAPHGEQIVQLSFQRSAVTGGEAALAVSLASHTLVLELLGGILSLCKEQGWRPPEVLGVDEAELRAFAQGPGKAAAAGTPPVQKQEAHKAAQQSSDEAKGGRHFLERRKNRNLLPREDRNIESLLALVVGTGSTIAEVQSQLLAELAALEVRIELVMSNNINDTTMSLLLK